MIPIPEVRMTWRARFYLTVAGFRHAGLGLVALLLDYNWANVDAGFSIPMWGGIFLFGSAHLFYSAVTGSEVNARISLSLSAVISAVWAASFWALALSEQGPTGILIAITFTALCAKDLTIVRDPLRSPFESIVQQYVEDAETDRLKT